MSARWLIVGAGLVFLVGYLFYARWLSWWLGLDDRRPTPAHRFQDGLDFVPTSTPVLFGHHFASIAGAGPIVGPILAASYGWLGVFLWLVLGAVLAGGVHDMGSMAASLQHEGRSIGELLRQYLGPSAQRLFLAFAVATLVLVVAAFDVIVAKTFVASPPVATASLGFLILALLFGLLYYRLRLPLSATTLLGLAGLILSIWLGFRFPLRLGEPLWRGILFAYIFLASVLPVWLLLQPRDYLNAFLLYALLLGALVGLFLRAPAVRLPAYTGFFNALGPLFPLLFVTTSCGALSGFHSLVASGTTARQASRESQARSVGYGAMLLESLLAVISLCAVVGLTLGDYQGLLQTKGPITVFALGVGHFLSALGLSPEKGRAFAALAVSAFALTSLDTATRVARFMLEELFSPSGQQVSTPQSRLLFTSLVVAAGVLLAFSGAWQRIWPLMGTANQLLAALALLALTVWLTSVGRPSAFVKLPAFFMLAVTLTALVLLAYRNFLSGKPLLALLAFLLLVLTLLLLRLAAHKVLFSGKPQKFV
ncbi:MAG: carbon starvation protein A [Thermodesulfatator sp.]|nr:MAG: carbon starvation protein A [Thermodesulfatator sp.]